jgi:hypothetical protein
LAEYEDRKREAFTRLTLAEEESNLYKARKARVDARMKSRQAELDREVQEAWGELAAIMADTGEAELDIDTGDRLTLAKVYRTTPRERVVVVDVEAVPDEYIKLSKDPMKTEIGQHLKDLRETGKPFPNWAQLERGAGELAWKVVKR